MAEFRLPPNSRVKQGKTYPAPAGATNVRRFIVYRYDPDGGNNPTLDTYEVDLDTCGPMVPEITVGIPQVHNFHVPGDWDYVKLKAQPLTYTIWTTSTWGYTYNVDTVLTLYDSNCMTVTQHDDNSLSDLCSTITWPITSTATYYIGVKHYWPDVGNCDPDYYYTLEISATSSLLSSTPEDVASLPSGLAHSAHLPPMLWDRTGIFLPVYRKGWDGLKRFP